MDLIDIVIPHFNNVEGCIKAVNSVLSQKLIVANVIIVDDKSSDINRAILKERLKNYTNVKIVERTINGGPGLARNTGLSHCISRYVSFLDSDDIFINEFKLANQITGLQNTDSVISATGYIEQSLGGKAEIIVDGPIHYKKLLRANYIGCSTVVIDFDKVDRNINLFSAYRRRQDWICWLQILKTNRKSLVHYLNETSVLYNSSNKSVSKTVSKIRLIHDTFRVYKVMGFSHLESFILTIRFLAFQAIKVLNKRKI